MKFDLHMHTIRYSPDSIIDPFALVRHAHAIGLDGIVITEHDRLWPETELEELRVAVPDLVVLGGMELTGRDGDVLVYGITQMGKLRRGLPWDEICEEVHQLGGAVVAAHPHRWEQDFIRILEEHQPELDGIEVMSNNMNYYLRDRAVELMGRYPHFATLGNSDAHELDVVGACYTQFAAEIRCNDDLVRAIRRRQATAVDSQPYEG